MAERKKKKNASLGPLFWVAVILLFIVLFLLNRKNIAETLEKTGLGEKFTFTKQDTELVAKDEEKVTDQIKKEPEKTETTKVEEQPQKTVPKPTEQAEPEQTEIVPAKKPEAVKPATADKPATTEQPVKPAPTVTKKPAEKPVAKVTTRKASLWFVKIDAEGNVARIETHRNIPQTDSPLSDALNELFRGTAPADRDKGLRSLIPPGTRLLSATVKDGVAILNVSGEFQFTEYGIEGYLGQLAQVVYTATVFPTVKSVQFLIDGQRREYLGAEGVWIGTPLSRDKF